MRVWVYFKDETKEHTYISKMQLGFVDAGDVRQMLEHGFVGHADEGEALIGIPASAIKYIEEIKEE